MKDSKRIWHYLYGEGVLVETRHRGLQLIAQFRDGVRRLVRGEDVQKFPSDGDNGHGTSLDESIEVQSFGPENSHCRSIIEALRLGVVPYGAVRDFTFGRDNEVSTIQKWLVSDDAGPLIIKAGYGSGKSHLMDYARTAGLDGRFAVAIVELDPKETPPYRPKLIYRRLIQSLRYRDGNGNERGFRDFARNLVDSGQDFRRLEYLYWVVSLLAQGQDDKNVWNWIEGQPGYYYLPTLYDEGTAANIFCHILSEIAWAAEHRLGLDGLLVILDEAENINEASQYQQVKGWHFIRGLMMLAANDDRLMNENVVCNYDSLQVGRYFGEHTSLVYSGRRKDIHYCLPDTSLKVAFAFTNKDVESWLNNWKIRNVSIELEHLPDTALEDVFRNIYRSYELAFKYTVSEDILIRALGVVKRTTVNRANLTRSFVKGSVEILDILRLNPGLDPEQIERKG